ncbi:hypothetical protein [Aquabacterium sp. OR-4]|uniref:hypothetical protein n=1 Tax=Aquabacterium sp. OR-4 TaxID=2978127 RepID=UPI0021B33042|nr:hypothetical protein [Aquabacterium sp. OR-4]MDT7834991.1 hypothetical protein [Aquabacterium sp. OR-4]
MEPRTMLQQMMNSLNYNTNSLARATRGKTKQPQIHRFLKGDAKEPKRSTWMPVAALLEIPVDAFYDPRAADAAWEDFQRRRGEGWSLPPAEDVKPSRADDVAMIVRRLPEAAQLEVLGFAARLLAASLPAAAADHS